MQGACGFESFGGLQTPRDEAQAILIPVAYDLTASYRAGARDGPGALLAASNQMELFDGQLGYSPTDIGVHTMEILEQVVSGPEAMIERVAGVVGTALDEERMPILIGGDHSVSIGAFQAFAKKGIQVTVLQLDAHADLRETYQGSRFSHACVMARCRDSFPAVQVGQRSFSKTEHERILKENLPFFPIWRFRSDKEHSLEEVRRNLGSQVYLTIDLDVLDPSIMPSTGTPEPGGMTWEEVLWFVESVTRGKEVVGFDLMELSPIRGNHAPDFLAAKLLNNILGLTRPPV